jgi:hypothetical protein
LKDRRGTNLLAVLKDMVKTLNKFADGNIWNIKQGFVYRVSQDDNTLLF